MIGWQDCLMMGVRVLQAAQRERPISILMNGEL